MAKLILAIGGAQSKKKKIAADSHEFVLARFAAAH